MTATELQTRTHDHAARYWKDQDGREECRVCGDPITCADGAVRHAGEQAHIPAADRADLRAVTTALDVARSALRDLPEAATDTDRAHAVITALYHRGALRHRIPAHSRRAGEMTALFPT